MRVLSSWMRTAILRNVQRMVSKVAVRQIERFGAAPLSSCKSYIRNEQYRDIRTWTRKGEHYWSGVSIKDPARTMIGKLAWDDSRGIAARRYIEKSYLGK